MIEKMCTPLPLIHCARHSVLSRGAGGREAAGWRTSMNPVIMNDLAGEYPSSFAFWRGGRRG
jgi:hypothetical protein